MSIEQPATNLVQNRSKTSLKLGQAQNETTNQLGQGPNKSTNKLGQGQSETTNKLGQGQIMEKLIEEEDIFAVFEEPEERLLPLTINCENLPQKQVHE